MTIRLPRLLSPDGTERCRLAPVKLRLELSLAPLSTAEMTLPADGPDVCVRDLIEIYDENGSAGIFRVTEIEAQPGLTRLVRLEHGLVTLEDGVVPAMSLTGSAREVLSALLVHQPEVRWALGEVALPEDATVLFTCGCQNLLSALTQLMELLPDGLMLAFDQTTAPWTLHLREMGDDDLCEGRISRNLTALHIVTDASTLCTRVYPFGAGQGTERIGLAPLTGQDYLDSPAMADWGCISRTFTAGAVFDAPTLRAVAEKYLARHSAPTVSITAEAVDLSAITGETADSFRLGRLCRLALPDHNLALQERIVAITRPDVIGQPSRVTLTLSNRLHDAADEIADLLREVTASRVIGGRVTDVTTHSRAEGTSTSPIEHYFRVEDWAAVLSCQVTFDADDGVRVVGVTLDGNTVSDLVYHDGRFDALPYLRRDSLGVISTGRHTLAIFPDSGAVNSTVTMKVIEKI